MSQINSILVATDFSIPARHAIERAAMLARDLRVTRLDLLHVVSTAPFPALRRLLPNEAERLEREAADHAEKALRVLADEIEQRFSIPVSPSVRTGNVLAEIIGAAQTVAAGLVVVGARGAHFIREFMLGSTAERIVSKITMPLLAVRRFPRDPYRQVLAPVDFSPYSKTSLETARMIAPDAQTMIVHAFDVPFEGKMRYASVSDEVVHSYRQQAEAAARQDIASLVSNMAPPAGSFSVHVQHGHPYRVILEKEREIGVDLIAIGKHGRSAIEEWILGSVTKHILAHANCDVLVSRHP